MDAAVDRAGIKLIHSAYENRPVAELRILAEELKKIPACVAYLASFDGQKVSLVVTCGESSGMDAKHLLNDLLSRINGRGGGDIRQAQGGGVATKEQYSKFFEDITLS